MFAITSTIEFWALLFSILGASITWIINEWRKRVWDQYVRKEESYKELLRCIEGFYVNSKNSDERKTELKTEFILQLQYCWLYCPDEVIQNGYEFLETVSDVNVNDDQARERALGNFVASIRKDLLSRRLLTTRQNSLEGRDFKLLSAN